MSVGNHRSAKPKESRALWFLLGAVLVAAGGVSWYLIEQNRQENTLSIELGLPNGDERELNLPLPDGS